MYSIHTYYHYCKVLNLIILFAAGVKFNAQVPAQDPPGAAARGRHQRTNHRPRAGGVQDLHLPRVRLHRSHRVSEPIGEYTLRAN